MSTKARTNPYKADALTSDTIAIGDKIIVWAPGNNQSVRRYTVIEGPTTDEHDDWYVVLQTDDGQVSNFLTSDVGLNGERYTGEWRHIAILDEEDG